MVPGGARRRPRIAGTGPVPLPAALRRTAERLGERVRRRALVPYRARAVVPAPVQPRAAGPRLEPPGGTPRTRGRAAVLVRARSGRRTHRLRRAARQGRRPARHAPRRRPAPLPRPSGAARDLPLLAAAGRRARSRADRRDLAAGPRAVRPLPSPRRTAHRLQLRFPGPPLGRGRAAYVHRPHAGRARSRRRPRHLGAGQPRRDPYGHPLRAGRGHRVRLRAQTLRGPHRPRPGHPQGPCRRAAHPGPARVRLPLPGRGAGPAGGRDPA